MTVDSEHRRLCHALLDALEAGDVGGVDDCYAPDMTMWINVSGETITRDVHMMCAHTVFDIDLVAEGVGRQIVASKEAAT